MTAASPRARARSAARLAAVQALYQHAMEGTPVAQLLHEFHQHRLGLPVESETGDEEAMADPDADLFDAIVSGCTGRAEEVDALVRDHLAAGWTPERLDRTLLQVLRAGTYELLARPDIPTGTVINEYLDVAHAFFDRTEVRFANGLLDAVARKVRS